VLACHSRSAWWRQGRPKGPRGLDAGGGRAWTNKELRALEDGLVWLGPGRAAELRAQVPGPTWCAARTNW